MSQKTYRRYTPEFKEQALGLLALENQSPKWPGNSRSATTSSTTGAARANPYHNAWTESFMGTLKAEMLQNGRFINATDARSEIFAFIDG